MSEVTNEEREMKREERERGMKEERLTLLILNGMESMFPQIVSFANVMMMTTAMSSMTITNRTSCSTVTSTCSIRWLHIRLRWPWCNGKYVDV